MGRGLTAGGWGDVKGELQETASRAVSFLFWTLSVRVRVAWRGHLNGDARDPFPGCEMIMKFTCCRVREHQGWEAREGCVLRCLMSPRQPGGGEGDGG